MPEIASNRVRGIMVILGKVRLQAGQTKWVLEGPHENSPKIDPLESKKFKVMNIVDKQRVKAFINQPGHVL